jgi:tetraacyldisaccharide 4'-kinase
MGCTRVTGDPRLTWQRRLGPLLIPAAWAYGWVQSLRRLAYRQGAFATTRVDTPVLSIGSLLAGGAGKTPLVRWVARQFAGLNVAILSRGYGGSYDQPMMVKPDSEADLVGDEPVLLAETCDADVWVAHKRAPLAEELAERYDVLLLDDGFQHLALERYLNICVLPQQQPGRVLPAGLWREGPGALRAADLVVTHPGWPDWISEYYDGPRIVIGFEPGPWQSSSGEGEPGEPFVAFCGIARPERFFESLKGLDVAAEIPFADHHPYTPEDLAALARRARAYGAEALVTTAKDAVRLRSYEMDLPLFWRDVELSVVAGETDLKTALDDVLRLTPPEPRAS